MQKRIDDAAQRCQRIQDKEQDLAFKKATEMIAKQEKAELIKANALRVKNDSILLTNTCSLPILI